MNIYCQTKSLTINALYFRNGVEINKANYYLLKKDSAFLVKYQNNKIILIDTFSSKYVDLLMLYDRDMVRIADFNIKEALYLHIYFDGNIVNNKVNKRFGGYLKIKNLFRRRYLIDDGLGYVTITPFPKQKFVFIN